MPRATMSIIIEDDGSVAVNGPLDDPITFHGMIGVAGDILRQYQAAKAKNTPRIALAPGPLPTLGH